MNKTQVIEALERCMVSPDCKGCPYYNMNDCREHMNSDALGLLKANEKAKATYTQAIVYAKRDNLLKWLNGRYPKFKDAQEAARIRAEYATEREIRLILLVRYEDNKCICRIRCPINPLPVKGEFQCVSTGEMSKLLKSMGWTYKEKIHCSMFK
jgi:hypothetical protein